MSERRRFIIIDPQDNVATAITELKAGDRMEDGAEQIVLVRDIPFGHKFARTDIPVGAYVIKYGDQIGRATTAIGRGEHVHIHNVQDIVDEVRKG
jgi:altronate dehydratase